MGYTSPMTLPPPGEARTQQVAHQLTEDGSMSQNAPITDVGSPASQPVVAPLAERDLPEAERIFRVAFGTFLGVPEPETFWADRDYVYGRKRAAHVGAFGATID